MNVLELKKARVAALDALLPDLHEINDQILGRICRAQNDRHHLLQHIAELESRDARRAALVAEQDASLVPIGASSP